MPMYAPPAVAAGVEILAELLLAAYRRRRTPAAVNRPASGQEASA